MGNNLHFHIPIEMAREQEGHLHFHIPIEMAREQEGHLHFHIPIEMAREQEGLPTPSRDPKVHLKLVPTKSSQNAH
jgi:hypothetical protein